MEIKVGINKIIKQDLTNNNNKSNISQEIINISLTT